MKNVIGEDKQLLKLAFDSLIESLLRDPFRLQSLFEYAMSSASTSTSSCTVNDKVYHDMQPSIYGKRYLSPDCEADCKQVECLGNIIIDESEKFYNNKIEEFTNRVISDLAAYNNNQLPLTSDEKQSIKESLPLGFSDF
jgi:hypothetical protein